MKTIQKSMVASDLVQMISHMVTTKTLFKCRYQSSFYQTLIEKLSC